MKFDFDADLQNQILALLIYSTSFLKAGRDLVEPDYFSSNEQWILCSLVYKLYDRYKKAPGTVQLKNELLHHHKKNNSSAESQELLETLRKRLKKLRKTVLKNKRYLEDQVVPMVQHEKTRLAFEKFIPLFNEGKGQGDALIEFVEELQEASRLTASTAQLEMPISEIEEEPVEWLWPGWIPRRTVMVLDGDPGCGKSLITVKMASVLTIGYCDGRKKKIDPTNVLILSAEDDPASVIKPRLAVAKANMSRIFIERIEEDEQNKLLECFQLNEKGLVKLKDALSRRKPGLVIIDTLFSYLGGQKDVLDPVTISRVVRQLSMVAKTYDCTFLLIRHLTKDPKGRSIYRGQGPMSIIGGARHALLAGSGPNDITSRALVVNKSNLAACRTFAVSPLFSTTALLRVKSYVL